MSFCNILVFFTSLETSVNPANLDQSKTHDIRLFHTWSCHALYAMIIWRSQGAWYWYEGNWATNKYLSKFSKFEGGNSKETKKCPSRDGPVLVNYPAYCQVIPALYCVQTYQNLPKTYQNHAETLLDGWDNSTYILQCTQSIATRTMLCDYYNSIFYIDLVQVNSFKCNF